MRALAARVFVAAQAVARPGRHGRARRRRRRRHDRRRARPILSRAAQLHGRRRARTARPRFAGGRARGLAALLAAGAALAGPGEFTRRAFLARKIDLSAAEAVADLIAAEHRSAARAAAARLSGGLGTEVERVRTTLERTLQELAAAIDFPDDVADPDRALVSERLEDARAALAALATTWERGRLVREGATVAIVGAPNAGKSSLFNALLGADRALVSPLGGTTRDTIEEALALDGAVARLIDTAGIRDVAPAAEQAALEAAGIARSHAALAGARVALVVVDASAPPSAEANAIVRAHARPRPHRLLQ